MFNFVWAHILTSSRTLKQRYGVDHNVNPREDLTRFGEKAVQEGKITRQHEYGGSLVRLSQTVLFGSTKLLLWGRPTPLIHDIAP